MSAKAEAALEGRASPEGGLHDRAQTPQAASFSIILSVPPSRLFGGMKLEPVFITFSSGS